jgi:phosphopantothenoylcysteine decarboxylase/phosphopantothenate--cysteine ligase
MTPLQTLSGKQIVVAVTGSIAAVEVVKLIHSLRRRGAEVQPVMSPAAMGIISPATLTYASGKQTITALSGSVEHVLFCGDSGSADLLLIAPCTANTIGKIACGIDDTPVTTFATTAIGSGIPLIIVPAMHHSMYRHPAVVANICRIRDWGVGIIDPLIEEGKAKIASNEEVVLHCERAVMGQPLRGRRVLITSGPCRERVDDVRVLTTRSSGQMGRSLALQAFRLGADVTVVHADEFPCVKNVKADSADEMRRAVLLFLSAAGGVDLYISAAAISDFAPKPVTGKIPSGKPVRLDLEPLPKLLDEVMSRWAPAVIAFKLGTAQEKRAKTMLRKGIAMVLVNTPETMGSSTGAYRQFTQDGTEFLSGTKDDIARAVWEKVRQTILP